MNVYSSSRIDMRNTIISLKRGHAEIARRFASLSEELSNGCRGGGPVDRGGFTERLRKVT